MGQSSLGSGMQLLVNSASAATIGAIVRGASGQTANMLEVQNSGSTTVGRLTVSGGAVFSGVGWFGAQSNVTGSQIYALAASAGTPGIVIQGAASQTADLQQWRNSAGTILGRVSSAGLVRTADNIMANAVVGSTGSADTSVTTSLIRIQANATFGGGWLQATRLNQATANIPADNGQVYFRTGTNPNTLKLCVRAGAGAEQTVFDNIPTT
jgi:hypothetical protein